MPEAIAFDTHRFVKNLTAHGFTEEQAEALATEQVAMLNSNLATETDIERFRLEIKKDIENLRLATEADLKRFQLETRKDIENLRLATEAKLEAVKSELLKWMFGAMIAQTGVIAAIIRLL